MFLVIRLIAGYSLPDHHPQVTQLPQQEIAARVCDWACPVRAVYISGTGVLIDAALDLERDPFAQSVLVHELVHFLQDTNGTFSQFPPCKRISEREREAYWIQDEYLLRLSGNGLTGMHYSNRFMRPCIDP